MQKFHSSFLIYMFFVFFADMCNSQESRERKGPPSYYYNQNDYRSEPTMPVHTFLSKKIFGYLDNIDALYFG